MLNTLRISLLALLSIGLYGALSVSYLTIMDIAACPSILNIPACYVVTAGYFLMLTATFLYQKNIAKTLFIIGWTPVLLLALIGSLLEVIYGDICPKSSIGIPLCYVSLSFAMLVALLYWRLNIIKPVNVNKRV